MLGINCFLPTHTSVSASSDAKSASVPFESQPTFLISRIWGHFCGKKNCSQQNVLAESTRNQNFFQKPLPQPLMASFRFVMLVPDLFIFLGGNTWNRFLMGNWPHRWEWPRTQAFTEPLFHRRGLNPGKHICKYRWSYVQALKNKHE